MLQSVKHAITCAIQLIINWSYTGEIYYWVYQHVTNLETLPARQKAYTHGMEVAEQ